MPKFTDPVKLLTNYHDLCDWLRQSRLEKNISIRGLAKTLEMSPGFVVETEAYRRRLTMTDYIRLCEALELDPQIGLDILKKKRTKTPKS